MKDEARSREFRRTHPPEKWSRDMLLAEVAELRGKTASQVTDEAKGNLERALAQVAALSSELSAARAEEPEGVAGDAVAGKPALATFRRKTWAKFSRGVVNLPTLRYVGGMNAVRLTVAKELIPDLYLLGLTAPRGSVEAQERDRLRRVLDSPAFVAAMARPEPWMDRLRVVYLSQVARAFFRPSVWAVYEHSSDEARLDRFGTVVK